MKTYYTETETGSLLVGTKEFGILVPNGLGDGEIRVKIGTKEELKNILKIFWTRLKGEFNIYAEDSEERAEDNILTILNGIYDVYYFNGTIYFEEKESK